MKFVLLALALLATLPAAQAEFWTSQREVRAAAVPPGMSLFSLFTIANDRDAAMNRLSLLLDGSSQIAGMYIEQLKPTELFQFTPADGVALLRDIESNEGATLFEGQGRKVIILQGRLNRATQEGRFTLKYLTNGLSYTYDSCDLLLKKDAAGWYAQNAYNNRKITAAKIVTWSLGITTIEGICRPR